MKVIVTGGAGFIGSHITDRLVKEGHDVMILDNFSTGNRSFIHKKASFTEVDITDAEGVMNVFQSFKPEAVLHLAAMVDLRESLDDPDASHKVNVVGSQNIISAAKEHGVQKIVFSSSAAVYGNNTNVPIGESEPIAPISPYGEQKAQTEKDLEASGIPAVVLRYANVYGPRQGSVGEGGVIAIFSKRLKNEESLTIFGSGEQTRDFVFVEDIVEANICALASSEQFAIYNVSTTEETSVLKLTEELLRISGKNTTITHSDPIEGEIMRNALDNTRIQQALEWQPKVSLPQGLEQTWDWFKKNV